MFVAKRTIQRCVGQYGPVKDRIVQKLQMKFKPSHLLVECESDHHAGGASFERHFYVQIASSEFEGLRTVQMHRLINQCLSDELAGPVHALRIDAFPTTQFAENAPTTPPKCEKN